MAYNTAKLQFFGAGVSLAALLLDTVFKLALFLEVVAQNPSIFTFLLLLKTLLLYVLRGSFHSWLLVTRLCLGCLHPTCHQCLLDVLCGCCSRLWSAWTELWKEPIYLSAGRRRARLGGKRLSWAEEPGPCRETGIWRQRENQLLGKGGWR